MAGSGCVTQILPLLRVFADYDLLSVKELKGILENLGKKIVDGIGEVAFNYCCIETISERALSEADKSYFRRFSSQLEIIVNREETLTKRRATLVSTPRLVRKISEVCIREF